MLRPIPLSCWPPTPGEPDGMRIWQAGSCPALANKRDAGPIESPSAAAAAETICV